MELSPTQDILRNLPSVRKRFFSRFSAAVGIRSSPRPRGLCALYAFALKAPWSRRARPSSARSGDRTRPRPRMRVKLTQDRQFRVSCSRKSLRCKDRTWCKAGPPPSKQTPPGQAGQVAMWHPFRVHVFFPRSSPQGFSLGYDVGRLQRPRRQIPERGPCPAPGPQRGPASLPGVKPLDPTSAHHRPLPERELHPPPLRLTRMRGRGMRQTAPSRSGERTRVNLSGM